MSDTLSPAALAALEPGAAVLVRSIRPGESWPSFYRATVVRHTPTQVVVQVPAARPGVEPREERYRLEDARRVGDAPRDRATAYSAPLVALVDPEDRNVARQLAEARLRTLAARVDRAYAAWERRRGNLTLALAAATDLQERLGLYLAALQAAQSPAAEDAAEASQ